MATQAVQYIAEVQDGLLTPATITSYLALPDTATLAQAQSALDVWAAAVDGVIDGAITRLYAVLTPNLPGGLKGATGVTWAASRVGQTGNINFSSTGTSRRWGEALPSFIQAGIVNGAFDLTNANVQAFITLLLNPTGFFTNPTEQSLEAVLDAWISFRKRADFNKSTAAV